MIALTTYEDARDAFRRRELRQALYDDGVELMADVIVNLHGEPHIDRRRLENRLFRRDTFAWYEAERIPPIIERVIGPNVRSGHGDLLPMARRVMMSLSVDVAGVDLPDGSEEEFDTFYELMDRLAKASTVAHATGDRDAIRARGRAALREFEERFFAPSLERRRRLIAATHDPSELPRDVLTTLLVNAERLELADDVVLREVAYFPWVGSHSTSGQLVHAMHHIFRWLEDGRGRRESLVSEPDLLQRFVHESMRLHPASPVAMRRSLEALNLRSGVEIPADESVAIGVEAANRDESVFGEDATEFNPMRALPDGVSPWGLSFGHGAHACLGQELAGGLEPEDTHQHHLLGAVTLMAARLLELGAEPDPAHPASRDSATTRVAWGSYPVIFPVG